MKPTIKVWPVPRLTEDQLKELLFDIVNTCTELMPLRVQGEDDIIVGFPQDALEFGLGAVLVVEIGIPNFLFFRPEMSGQPAEVGAIRDSIGRKIAQTVRNFFTKYGYGPHIQFECYSLFGQVLE